MGPEFPGLALVLTRDSGTCNRGRGPPMEGDQLPHQLREPEAAGIRSRASRARRKDEAWRGELMRDEWWRAQ